MRACYPRGMTPDVPDLIEELRWRGLLHQCTDEPGLRAHLADHAAHPRRVYCGFDPTADSLTIGNLVPIMLLRHVQRAGHHPVVVVGGGTGLIGDPSGKTEERQLLTAERVAHNVQSQMRIFGRLLDFAGARAATLRNNLDWLGTLGFLDALRDIGKHFSVNVMIQKDSVRDRLHGRDQGISYTEFSYQLLQSYDFVWLREHAGVTLQVGGSDQWGNIVAGVDLVRRMYREEVFGLTAPLVTKADGGKFGKTETGAIWLTPERTSVYAYHQFWLNADDRDAGRFLRIFTLLPREEIEAIEAQQAADPGQRAAQRALAREATTLLHGREEMERAEAAGRALFSGDIARLDAATLEEIFAGAPTSNHHKHELAGDGKALADLLVETGLAKSKREAREFLANGSVSINGEKIGPDDRLTPARLLHGAVAAIEEAHQRRRGGDPAGEEAVACHAVGVRRRRMRRGIARRV